MLICSADGCGAGIGVAFIAISIAAYHIAKMYFEYKKNKND